MARLPDVDEIVARLVSEVTDAIVDVVGEHVRDGVTVELVGTPAGRTGIGGVVVTSQRSIQRRETATTSQPD